MINILCVGDVVGKPGREGINQLLGGLKEEFSLDLVVVNAENSAAGAGLTSKIAGQLFSMGCHVLTLGDHAWDQKELEPFLDQNDFVIRPANFPKGVPGKGWTIIEITPGVKVGVINLIGRVFMRYQVNCPFLALDEIVAEIRKVTPIIILDMHAETTSEKIAMGHYCNGKISAMVGTHTHVQTADEQILSQGTAYITDLGMTGPHDSVIGQKKEQILQRFLTSMPVRFQVASDRVILNGVVITIDERDGTATQIQRVHRQADIIEDSQSKTS